MSGPLFIVLSFEGPDGYSRAGGLASRIIGLTESLATRGAETHLFFVGDPRLPGYETRCRERLHLHRWCQWISRYHPGGVYDGEEAKLADWNRSLPAWASDHLILPAAAGGRQIVVLAEEWHTAASLLALHRIAVARGLAGRVAFFWNANNTFGADRVPWSALRDRVHVTTVSRYMKQALWRYGVDAGVVPNGIEGRWLEPVSAGPIATLRRVLGDRLSLLKVARFDPDKRWHMAVDSVAMLKRLGAAPIFLARGGMEAHGSEVSKHAAASGIVTARVTWDGPGFQSLLAALRTAGGTDMVLLDGYLSEEQRRVLYSGVHCVLANSGIEPFGLVGLETMASGGVAMVGSTGEDYSTNGHDSISIQTSEPAEIVHHALALRNRPATAIRLRAAARVSAARYTWDAVLDRVLLPYVAEHGIDVEGIRSELTVEAKDAVPAGARIRRIPMAGARARPGSRVAAA